MIISRKNDLDLNELSFSQKVRVDEARLHSAGMAVYLGQDSQGAHAYFWAFGSWEGVVQLPFSDLTPHFDCKRNSIFLTRPEGGEAEGFWNDVLFVHEYTRQGSEVFPAKVDVLYHLDLRRVAGKSQAEPSVNSIPPDRVARKYGLVVGEKASWIGNIIRPQMSLEAEYQPAVIAITHVYPSGKKREIL